MKRHLINLVFCFLTFPLYLFAQNKIYTIQDTAFANRLLSESAAANRNEKFQLALVKADSALQIFEQVLGKESVLVSNALTSKAGAYRGMNKFDEAILYHDKALPFV